jgi:hypothetical protein
VQNCQCVRGVVIGRHQRSSTGPPRQQRLSLCLPYLASLPDTVADLAGRGLHDRQKPRVVGGRCGLNCGQRSPCVVEVTRVCAELV